MFRYFLSCSKYIKHIFWLVICIAKDYIWTTLKVFVLFLLLFLFAPCEIQDFQIIIVLSKQTTQQWKKKYVQLSDNV